MPNLETLLPDQAIEVSDHGDKDLVISIYQKNLPKRKNWATIQCNLGLIYKYWNEWDKSYHIYKRALDLDPEMEAETNSEYWILQGIKVKNDKFLLSTIFYPQKSIKNGQLKLGTPQKTQTDSLNPKLC